MPALHFLSLHLTGTSDPDGMSSGLFSPPIWAIQILGTSSSLSPHHGNLAYRLCEIGRDVPTKFTRRCTSSRALSASITRHATEYLGMDIPISVCM